MMRSDGHMGSHPVRYSPAKVREKMGVATRAEGVAHGWSDTVRAAAGRATKKRRML